jgi:hypothetical protein
MQFVDTSVMYHLVRGQGVIKLYIFYNMVSQFSLINIITKKSFQLEVADKLFSSFGQVGFLL